MSLNVTTRTVLDIAATVRRQFGDESGVQITDNDIYRWVTDGQKDIAVKNKVLKGRAQVDSVSGQAEYSMPLVNIASIESIHWDGSPLAGLPYPEVESYIKDYSGNAAAAGVPVVWYEWAGTITFWPKPATTTVAVITLLYTRLPDAVTGMADVLSLPDRYFNTLVKYVLSQAYEMDEDWDASNFKIKQLGEDLDNMADDERSTSSMTYPVINALVEY